MAKVSNVSLEIRQNNRYARKDGSGYVRRIYGAGSVSDADVARVDADGNPALATDGGAIGVSILTPDATLRDANGKAVVIGSFINLANVILTRDTDEDGEPATTSAGFPVHRLSFTAESTVEVASTGFSFDETFGEPASQG